jgi:hypothetical protein
VGDINIQNKTVLYASQYLRLFLFLFWSC